MAVATTGTPPSAVTWNAGTGNGVTSSFDVPAGGVLVVAMVELDLDTGTCSASVADNKSSSWSELAISNGGSYAGVWVAYFASSSTGVIITATPTNAWDYTATGRMDVIMLSGADVIANQTATPVQQHTTGTATLAYSLTTTVADSLVVGAATSENTDTNLSAYDANTTTIGYTNGGAGGSFTHGSFRAAAATGTPGALTYGFSESTDINDFAAIEILPGTANYTKELAGTISSSGDEVNVVSKSLSASINNSGTQINATSKSFNGTLSAASLSTQLTGKLLSAVITLSGLINRSNTKAIIGTISDDGILSQNVSKSMSGVISSTGVGTFTRKVIQVLLGVLTSTGSLNQSTTKSLSGLFTSDGAITRQTSNTFNGTLSSSGLTALLRAFFKSFNGTLNASGALTRYDSKSLSADISTSGLVTHAIAKVFSGIVASSATLTNIRVILRTFTATVTSTSTLTRNVSKSLFSDITPIGYVNKYITQASHTASIAFTGILSTVYTAYASISTRRIIVMARRMLNVFSGSEPLGDSISANEPDDTISGEEAGS